MHGRIAILILESIWGLLRPGQAHQRRRDPASRSHTRECDGSHMVWGIDSVTLHDRGWEPARPLGPSGARFARTRRAAWHTRFAHSARATGTPGRARHLLTRREIFDRRGQPRQRAVAGAGNGPLGTTTQSSKARHRTRWRKLGFSGRAAERHAGHHDETCPPADVLRSGQQMKMEGAALNLLFLNHTPLHRLSLGTVHAAGRFSPKHQPHQGDSHDQRSPVPR